MGFFGKITDAIGITDNEGKEAARKLSAQAMNNANAMSKEQIALMKEELQFQKDQYADWKGIYGDMQENLGEYYNSLDPDDFAVMGLQNQQREYQEAVKLIEKDAAARGIANSGMVFGAKAGATVANAMGRASIRTNAEGAVAGEKMKFLGLGLGQGTEMLGNVNNASANASNAFGTGVASGTNMATNFLSNATSLSNQGTSNMTQTYGNMIDFAKSR